MFIIALLGIVFVASAKGQTFSAQCDTASQQRIETCARELTSLGVFGQQNVARLNQMTVNDLRTRSRDYFLQTCNAYNRFNQCLGGQNIKEACYPQEPMKARFAVADAALDYACGEGYTSMLEFWDCYLDAATRADVTVCETRITQDAARPAQYQYNQYQYADQQTGATACYALKNYMSCIRKPIEDTCSYRSWAPVVEAIQRPVNVYLPYCTLAASTALPSVITLLTLLFGAVLFKSW